METVKGHCVTNLDDYKMTVNEFYKVPNIGERVSCLYKGNTTSLKVCQIIHDVRGNKLYIIVELHKNI